MPIRIQVQMSPGCGHGERTLELVREVLGELAPDARLETVTIATLGDAQRLGFRGSPSVLVDGADIERGRPGGVALG
jgi:hypothetical protein